MTGTAPGGYGERTEVRGTELQLVLQRMPRAPAEVLRRTLVFPWGSCVVLRVRVCGAR